MAASASSRRMAGSTVMSRVPAAIRARTRRAPAEVGFAGGSLPARSGHPDIDDDELRPGGVGQDVDGRPATTKLATICAVTLLG